MKSLFRPFPTPLTNRQWFYLLVLQGVGAGIIDGGANFAVAYAMYHNQKVIKMWVLSKNTIAGDLGVTPIIQCLASMLITSTLVHTDLHHDAVKPLNFVWPHVEHLPDPRLVLDRFGKSKKRSEGLEGSDEKARSTPSSTPSPAEREYNDQEEDEGEDEVVSKGLVYYIKMLIRFIFEGTENNSLLPLPHSKPLPIRIFLTAVQGAAIGIIFGLPLFLIFMIVLGPLYGHGNLVEEGRWRWAPMVIKCIYGAVLGWVTNPVIACLALGSQAEHHLVIVTQEEDLGQVERGVETINEDDELEQLQPPPPILSEDVTTGSLRVPPLNQSPTKPNGGRSRALSSLSTASSSRSRRPPLIANCSTLPIASSNSIRRGSLSSIPRTPRSAPLPNNEFGSLDVPTTTRDNQPGTPAMVSERPPLGSISRNTQKRNRGATISTYISHSDSINSNYSYALGGTGGRAQRGANRPRAISSLSGRNRTADVQSPNINSPRIKDGSSPRSPSSVVGQSGGTLGAAGSGGKAIVNGPPAVWDVFGKVQESSQTISDKSPMKISKIESERKEKEEEAKDKQDTGESKE